MSKEENYSPRESIKAFNNLATRAIRKKGAFRVTCPNGQAVVIEAESYRADDSIDGFMGWWDDDHSVTTHADTPYEVYWDMYANFL